MNFKDYFNWELVNQLGTRASLIDHSFDQKRFENAVSPNLLSLEMKDRVRSISSALYLSIDKTYPEVTEIILGILELSEDIYLNIDKLEGFPAWVIADIVERYGVDYPEISLQALKKITPHFTSEFAIRPYLQHHRELTLSTLHQWTADPSADVRRLVSEGIRPKLPWGKKVDWLIEHPSEIFLLLDKLYEDDSEYVRRSVANNLNDISKDHPEKVIQCLKAWQEKEDTSKHLKWIIRQGCRGLIKQSHVGALELQGYSPHPDITITQFEIHSRQIALGEKFEVSLVVDSDSQSDQALLIDLELMSQSPTGKSRRRILKWCRRDIKASSTLSIVKKWPIKDTTIRKEIAGTHSVNLIINGQNLGSANFEVVEKC